MKEKFFASLLLLSIVAYADDGVASFSNSNINQYLDKHDQSIIDNTNVYNGQNVVNQESKEQAMQPKVTPQINTENNPQQVIVVNQQQSSPQPVQSGAYNYGYYYPDYYPYSYNNYDRYNSSTYNRVVNSEFQHYVSTHGGDYVAPSYRINSNDVGGHSGGSGW